MKKDTKVSKFINEYVKANHIMEVETLSDSLDRIDIVIPDKNNKPYDFMIGNKHNFVSFERGQSSMSIWENHTRAYGATTSDIAIKSLEKSLLKLEASVKNLEGLSLYDMVIPGDDFYMSKITFKDRVLYCMGTKHRMDENIKTMQNVSELIDYTLCGVANPYIVTRLLKALSSRKDFKMFADTTEYRISYTVSETSYNFILDKFAFYDVIALALDKSILIRPFHKGGKVIEQI